LAFGAFVAFLLIAATAVPFLFRSRVEARVKTEVNRAVNARVAWGNVGLSLIRDFPSVALTLDRLSVVGLQPFERDTLVAIRQVRLVLDLGSVLRHLRTNAPVVVREITLRAPAAKLHRLADGTANWDITRPRRVGAVDTTSAAS